MPRKESKAVPEGNDGPVPQQEEFGNWDFTSVFENMAKANIFSKYDGPFLERAECTESPLKNGGFSFHGIPASDSPAGAAPLVPAPASDR